MFALGIQLAGTWMRAPHSTSSVVAHGQPSKHLLLGQQLQPQQVLQHPALKAVAEELDCKKVLAAGKEYSSQSLQLLQYSETAGRPLLLDKGTDSILWWIMNNEGEQKVHTIFRHLLSTCMWVACLCCTARCGAAVKLAAAGSAIMDSPVGSVPWH
jgi:hypothetical protein